MVFSHTARHWAAAPSVPSIPLSVTSIAKDGAATVSWRHPGDNGTSEYVIASYAGGSPGPVATVSAGTAATITGSDGNTYLQAPVTGLANSTAYTFTVKAANSHGFSAESSASGANTPLSGLVFGDDFNGPSRGPIDPEWWVYTRCGYLAQNEVEGYSPDHCVLDGSGNLALIAEKVSWTGPRYPSDPSYPGTITQPWTSGACQSNTRTYVPAAGNTMTFEARVQTCPDITKGMWPGLFWLNGQDYLNAWKTDPAQVTNLTGKAEIDTGDFPPNAGCSTTAYLCAMYTDVSDVVNVGPTPDMSASMHVVQARWKPGVSVRWFRDGTETRTAATTHVPTTSCQFFLLLYLQIMSPVTATATQQCSIDYVRVYDQNLG